MDSTSLSFIEDLTPAMSFWNMKCKIIKIWKQSYRWDMILLDCKGNKIQCCVKTQLLPDFERVLKEDEVVVIRNFGVGDQKDRVRVIPLDIKINFFKSTSVTVAETWEGHPFGFNFTDFSEIITQMSFKPLTVDVIGKLAWCGDLALFQTGDRDCKRMNFEMQDTNGVVLKCTFWDAYAEDLNNFVSSNVPTEMD